LSEEEMLPLLKSSSAWLLLSRCQSLIYSLSTDNLRELAARHTGVTGNVDAYLVHFLIQYVDKNLLRSSLLKASR
jgi:hypothetical protein